MLFFSLCCACLRFTCFSRGGNCTIVWLRSGLNNNRLSSLLLFFANASKRGVDGILIFCRRLYGSLFMPCFAGDFLAFQALLACFKARFSFCRTLLFLTNGADFGLLLAEILYQRNAAWADPRTGTAFDAVGKVVRRGFIVLLAFAEPVKLLWQQICRASIGTGAAANAAFLFFGLTHFSGRRRQQTVGDFHHRHVKPGQSKAHQRAAHNHHLIAGRAKIGMFEQVLNRCTQTRPNVARFTDGLTGQRHHAFSQRLAINYRTFYGVSGTDVLHQYADVR